MSSTNKGKMNVAKKSLVLRHKQGKAIMNKIKQEGYKK